MQEFVDESKLRVVIVEDSAMIRMRLAEALAEIGNVEIIGYAESETGAVELLRNETWDAAILDLQLRSGTGLGVLKVIANDRWSPHAKIIVFTNYAFPQYRERSLRLGADYFFDKARELDRVSNILADLAVANPPATH